MTRGTLQLIGAVSGLMLAGGIVDAGDAMFGSGATFKLFAATEFMTGLVGIGFLIGIIAAHSLGE